MKHIWLYKNQGNRLLVFCNGAGMDARPFVFLKASDLDVLCLYNYSDLTLSQDLIDALNGYDEISLIAWSMGVWAAQHLFPSIVQRFKHKIAVNGTHCPIHDRYGIPVEIFKATHAGYDGATRLKFYRRMCREREILDRFLAHQPQRSVDDQKQELGSLLAQTDCCPAQDSIFTDIIVSKNDSIVLTENQLQFWREKNVRLIDGTHFLFYDWNSWNTLLNDLGQNSISGRTSVGKGLQDTWKRA
jgi:pimeloyl-[acyl-carrier protein] methyl ester esterase